MEKVVLQSTWRRVRSPADLRLKLGAIGRNGKVNARKIPDSSHNLRTSSGQPVVTPTNEFLLRNRDGFFVPVKRRRVLDPGTILATNYSRSESSRTIGLKTCREASTGANKEIMHTKALPIWLADGPEQLDSALSLQRVATPAKHLMLQGL